MLLTYDHHLCCCWCCWERLWVSSYLTRKSPWKPETDILNNHLGCIRCCRLKNLMWKRFKILILWRAADEKREELHSTMLCSLSASSLMHSSTWMKSSPQRRSFVLLFFSSLNARFAFFTQWSVNKFKSVLRSTSCLSSSDEIFISIIIWKLFIFLYFWMKN